MSCHYVLELGALASPSGYTNVFRVVIYDYLGPYTKKLIYIKIEIPKYINISFHFSLLFV